MQPKNIEICFLLYWKFILITFNKLGCKNLEWPRFCIFSQQSCFLSMFSKPAKKIYISSKIWPFWLPRIQNLWIPGTSNNIRKKTLSKKLRQSGQEIDFSRYPFFGANFWHVFSRFLGNVGTSDFRIVVVILKYAHMPNFRFIWSFFNFCLSLILVTSSRTQWGQPKIKNLILNRFWGSFEATS